MRHFLLLIGIQLRLFATCGIAVACNDHYVGYLLPSIAYLRMEFKTDIPIEIWYAGDELSEESKALLSRFGNMTFHNLVDVFGGDAKDYWGYQIKGYMLKASHFDEVMIVDADVYFAQDPTSLFTHPGYLETGAFFFRDLQMMRFCHLHDQVNETAKGCLKWKHYYLESYWARRAFFQELIPSPSRYLPSDMRFFWENIEPSENNKLLIHYQESGVVLIDKSRHRLGVENILELNRNHEEIYKMVFGDKETYWMGMEMAGEPYTFNSGYPRTVRGKWLIPGIKRQKIGLVHQIDGKLFWFQKKPVALGSTPFYEDVQKENFESLSKEEIWRIEQIGYYVKMFGLPTKN